GRLLVRPVGIALLPNGDVVVDPDGQLIVADEASVIRINPATGERILIRDSRDTARLLIDRPPAGDEVLNIAYFGNPPAPPPNYSKPKLGLDLFVKRRGQASFGPVKDGDALTS